jgi:hypothetical protein
MRSLFRFRCPHCGRKAEVCGGADAGMFADAQTVACQQCQTLLDVFVRRAGGV